MSEESLIVKLKGDTADLDKKLDATNKSLDETSNKTKKAENSFIKFERGIKTVDIGVSNLATSALALGAALTTVITLSAKSERELQALSRQAKLATGDFEALAAVVRTQTLPLS